MKGFDLIADKVFESHPPSITSDSRFVLICNANKLHKLLDVFGWDKDTVDQVLMDEY